MNWRSLLVSVLVCLVSPAVGLAAEGPRGTVRVAVIGPDGKLIGKYRKQKLGHETVRNTPGTESLVFPTPYGRMGVMICADRRFPRCVT